LSDSSNPDRVALSEKETRDIKGTVIYRTRIATVDLRVLGTDQPLDTLKRAERILGQFKGEVDQKPRAPPIIPPAAPPGSVAAVSDEVLIAELAKLPWEKNSTGPSKGVHCLAEKLPFPVRAALFTRFRENPVKTLRLGEFNFSRFAPDEEKAEGQEPEYKMLGRFPAKKEGEA